MIDKKNEKVISGYDYRKRYNRILFWLILFFSMFAGGFDYEQSG